MSPCDRLPPEDVEAERALIGGILIAQGLDVEPDLGGLRAIVRSASFAVPQHGTIFAEALAAYDAHEPITGRNIVSRLNARTERDWESDIAQICNDGEPANLEFYARKVRDAFSRREIIRLANRTRERAFNLLEPLEDTVVELARGLDAIEQSNSVDREPTKEADLLRELANPRDHRADRIPVALGYLGRLLDDGFDLGSLVVVGARPSCGKTSLGVGLCVHASGATGGCPTLFVSVEMSTAQVTHRLLSMRSGLAVRRIRSGEIHDDEFTPAKNKAALQADAGEPIFVLDGVRDVRAIAAVVRRYARRKTIGMAVVDYVGLLNMPGDYERHDLKIGAITSLFKALAVDMNICVVLLAQLSRRTDYEKRRPQLADLKDSGCIEADADVVLLIHRTAKGAGPICDTDIIVAKQRQGDTGVAHIEYDKRRMAYQAKVISTGLRCEA